MNKITISEAAKIMGVSKKTLMRWDKQGKFTSNRDPSNNFRYYNKEEVEVQALWLRLRIKDRNHNRKLTAVRKAADRFSAIIPLHEISSPQASNFDEMKKVYADLNSWKSEHKKIREEYSKIPSGFKPKIDVADFENKLEDEIASFVKDLVSLDEISIRVEGNILFYNLNLDNNSDWQEISVLDAHLYQLEEISEKIRRAYFDNTEWKV